MVSEHDEIIVSEENSGNDDEQPLSPWLTIWIFPRNTIRQIVDTNPRKNVILLSGLAGIFGFFDRAMGNNLGDIVPFIYLILLMIILGPLLGIVAVYIGGIILNWTGSLFGGVANQLDVRAAIAWSSLPGLLISIFNLPKLLLFRDEAFTSMTLRTDAILHSNLLFLQMISIYSLVLMLLGVVFSLWGVIILIINVAEVNRFSVWKSILSIVIPLIGATIFLVLMGILLG